jgi:hypothetical protein
LPSPLCKEVLLGSRFVRDAAAKSDAESNAQDYESFGHGEENITLNMQGPAPIGSVRKSAGIMSWPGDVYRNPEHRFLKNCGHIHV